MDSENRIKEFKDDLSLHTFCLQESDAINTAFRLGCVGYNLLAGFREYGVATRLIQTPSPNGA